jgi:hypothetical protein
VHSDSSHVGHPNALGFAAQQQGIFTTTSDDPETFNDIFTHT